MTQIPVLMITYNRLEYTRQALDALFNSRWVKIYIIDNGSTDGTQSWFWEQPWSAAWNIIINDHNQGVAGAMNQFLNRTQDAEFVGKVDNDTIVQPDWCEKLLAHMDKADIVQAKHPILKATHPAGFDDWVKGMPADGALRYHHFVGGSGILFRRNIVKKVPDTEWVLGGWRQFQRDHPQLRKAFATDVQIKLLDTTEDGADYSKFPDYYRETKRL